METPEHRPKPTKIFVKIRKKTEAFSESVDNPSAKTCTPNPSKSRPFGWFWFRTDR